MQIICKYLIALERESPHFTISGKSVEPSNYDLVFLISQVPSVAFEQKYI